MAMQFDARLDLPRVSIAVAEGRVDLGAAEILLDAQSADRISLAAEILQPQDDFPDVWPADQAGPAARRSVPEGDERVLVATGALVGVPAQPVGKALARGPGPEPQTFGESVVEAHRHIL